MGRRNDTSDLILLLRGQVVALKTSATEINTGMNPEEAVEAGELLWKLIVEARDAAGIIREVLRDEAGTTPGRHELRGSCGAVASVYVHEPRPVMRKDVDLHALRVALGERCFNRLFTVHEQATPAADFAEQVARMPEEDRKVVLDAVDITTAKSRVSFNNGK